MASDYDDVILINQGWEYRTRKSGKTRATIKVTSEPIAVNLNPKALGAPVAAAIVHHLRERILGIAAIAAPATIRAREGYAKAFAQGKAWALKRYAGGKTGAMAPNQSDRLFNDSGRFARSITGNASKDGSWRINLAANRLSGDTRTIQTIYDKLVSLVPEFVRPELLLQNDIIRKTIEKTAAGMHKKLPPTARAIDVLRAGAELVRTIGDVIEGAIGA